MQHTAKGIASLGRNGDDTLLHVNKEELVGLQALLGPVTVNPETGLPEAFQWTDILKSLGLGLAGAVTGGAAFPLLGTVGATAVGAGTGAILGGGISAAEGKGFGPGALGGLVSGGTGGFGAADIPGGPTTLSSTGADAVNTLANAGPESGMGNLSAVMPEEQIATPPPSMWDQYTSNLSQTGSAMLTKPGMEHLIKPVGMGTLLGVGAESTADAANTGATQMRQEKLKQALADKQQREYFASLGFPLPEEGASTSWSPAAQRNYFGDLIYGAAAGGPIELSRSVAGVPVNTTIPPKYVSKFENADLNESLTPALQDIRQTSAQLGSRLGYANGGYINTQPMGAEPYPQSQIPRAQPYPAATPQRHEVVSVFAGGGSAYEKGGFLDGPGDGMSDDIPANIDGREEIRLADGEFVVPPEMVSLIGGGDPEEGKRLLDQLLPMVRQAAHGKKEQIKQDAGKLAAEKLLTRKAAKGDAGRSGIEAAH